MRLLVSPTRKMRFPVTSSAQNAPFGHVEVASPAQNALLRDVKMALPVQNALFRELAVAECAFT